MANAFDKAIARRIPEGWFLSGENPMALNLKDDPLPDFTVANGEPLDFLKRSDTSLRATALLRGQALAPIPWEEVMR